MFYICCYNAAVTIGFTKTSVDVVEGMSFEACVTLTNGSLNIDVVVVVTSMDGTAGETGFIQCGRSLSLQLYSCVVVSVCL